MAADYPSDQIGPGVDDEIIGNSVVARRVGQPFDASSGDTFVRFGPFEPGECCRMLRLYWEDDDAIGVQGLFAVALAAFGLEPKSDGSDFANGRPMTGASVTMPGGLLWAVLPVCWVATLTERWIVLKVAPNTSSPIGSAWVVVEG